MRRNLLVAASALALIAVPALAQTTSPGASNTPRSAGTGTSPSTAPQAAPKADPLKQDDISEIKGAAVYGSDDKKIGSVSNVLMKPESKQIDRLVVAQGGLLGVGAHHVALPVDQFKWDQQKEGFRLAKTSDDLKSMAEWQDPSRATTSGSGSSNPPARVETGSPPPR